MGLFSRSKAPVPDQSRAGEVRMGDAMSDLERLRFAVQIIQEAQARMTIIDVEGREIRQPCCERLSIIEAALTRFNAELGV